MKLKTKLIPLASVATVCATVAPLTLTSCGTNEFVDLTKTYTPTFDKLERTEENPLIFDEVDATNAWTEYMLEHKDYISQEYYWTQSNDVEVTNRQEGAYELPGEFLPILRPTEPFIRIDPLFDPEWPLHKVLPYLIPLFENSNESKSSIDELVVLTNSTYNISKEKMTNIRLSSQELVISWDGSGEEWLKMDIPTISFTLEFERKWNEITSSTDRTRNVDVTVKGKEIFEDVPLIVKSYPSTFAGLDTWNIVPFYEWGDYIWGFVLNETGREISDSQDRLISNLPEPWNVTVDYDYDCKGSVSDKSGNYPINWSQHTTQNVYSEDFLELPCYPEFLDESPLVKVYSQLMSYHEFGLATSWYLYSCQYEESDYSWMCYVHEGIREIVEEILPFFIEE